MCGWCIQKQPSDKRIYPIMNNHTSHMWFSLCSIKSLNHPKQFHKEYMSHTIGYLTCYVPLNTWVSIWTCNRTLELEKIKRRDAYILCLEERFIHNCRPFWVPWAAGISEWTIPLPAVIHCTSPAPIVPLCPSKSSCVMAPWWSKQFHSTKFSVSIVHITFIHIPPYRVIVQDSGK